MRCFPFHDDSMIYYSLFITSARCKSVQKQHSSSQTLQATSPVLPISSTWYQTPLELSKVLSDCARAFSDAPESTCSYWGAFRMIQDLTYRIVKLWSSWDLCADVLETWREAETTAQSCRIVGEQARPLRSSVGYFEISPDHCAALRETWCRILTAVVLT
jgi:hypothetical protein